jgi:hypothetical protein
MAEIEERGARGALFEGNPNTTNTTNTTKFK